MVEAVKILLRMSLSFFGGGGGGGFGNTQGGNMRSSSGRERFQGTPGQIIRSRDSYERATRIGSDGRANRERHYSDHGNPRQHTNPHDHNIRWDASGNPQFSRPINYRNGNVPELEYEGGN